MEDDSTMYLEAFVESPDGYRYRICQQDGSVQVEYHEWKEATREYITSVDSSFGFPAAYAAKIIAAIKLVADSIDQE